MESMMQCRSPEMLAAIVDVAREVSKCQVNSADAHKQQSNQQQDPPSYNPHLSELAHDSSFQAVTFRISIFTEFRIWQIESHWRSGLTTSSVPSTKS